jgi:adenylyl-sulfate kinase
VSREAADPGVTVWLTGLPSSGKSSIAEHTALALRERGRRVEVLDGDAVRAQLSPGLGFSRHERDLHVRRLGYVAQLLTRNGVIVLVAAISPYAETRQAMRALITRFIEVHVACPLAECERRDVKGLYAKARAGQLPAFTGVSDPYEPPAAPDLVLHTAEQTLEQSVQALLQHLERRGWLEQAIPAAMGRH